MLRYISTAIPYVNAAPHVGFALEMVQADSLARFYRQMGDEVWFQTGTDENSIKNVQAAQAVGMPVADLVAHNAAKFLALKSALALSFDDFIRTSIEPRHHQGVNRLWHALAAQGDIYKQAYRGLYCIGCEQFYKADDLSEGRCPEHQTIPDVVEEENWFFRLSRYTDRLRQLYADNTIVIVPETRRREVQAWLDSGLEDFSISRSAARAHGWGIPVPDDPEQVIYVWFDALGNYITALHYGDERSSRFECHWQQADSREHCIGKGITRFHAIYWPAMLLSAGLVVPTRILVHGYVTVDGNKIGKSFGNAVDPVPLADTYGADALRYYLLRHIRSTDDGDFSLDRFHRAYRTELADQLGNLVHRVLSMIERYLHGSLPSRVDRSIGAGATLPDDVANHIQAMRFDRALDAIFALVADGNRYVMEQAPWALAKAERTDQLVDCLASLVSVLRAIAQCLEPLLPNTSRQIHAKLNSQPVRAGQPLFPVDRP